MSKPQVITLPFVLLLWDYWPLERVRSSALRLPLFARIASAKSLANSEQRTAEACRWLLLEKVPLLALCVASAVLTVNAQARGGATSYYGLTLRLENALVSYARYLGKAFWPSRLALFYPYPLNPYPLWQVCGAAFILLAISLAVALAYRRRYLTVGWLWFLGTLVPMIGLSAGRHAGYGRPLRLSARSSDCSSWCAGWSRSGRRKRTCLPGFCARRVSWPLLALALVSYRQVGFWNDHITLWTHALEVTNNNWVAENNLGTALLKTGRMEEAIPHFRAAVALDPSDPNSTMNIGTYEQCTATFPLPSQMYKKAAEMARNPKVKARAYNNLAYAYKDSGDLADARTNLQTAVAVDPEFVGAWISLGLVAQRMGDLPLAINSYSRAMQIHPSDFGYLLLAGALEASGDHTQAVSVRQKAALLSSNLIAAQHYADKLLAH